MIIWKNFYCSTTGSKNRTPFVLWLLKNWILIGFSLMACGKEFSGTQIHIFSSLSQSSHKNPVILVDLFYSFFWFSTMAYFRFGCYVSRSTLVPGDIVMVTAGQIIPADIRVIAARGAYVLFSCCCSSFTTSS